MDDREKIEKLQAAVYAGQHAMQSGIALLMNKDSNVVDPKHLRVGVNSALVELGVVTRLMVSKGIITELEYWEAMFEAVTNEVKAYQDRINAMWGGNSNITLL